MNLLRTSLTQPGQNKQKETKPWTYFTDYAVIKVQKGSFLQYTSYLHHLITMRSLSWKIFMPRYWHAILLQWHLLAISCIQEPSEPDQPSHQIYKHSHRYVDYYTVLAWWHWDCQWGINNGLQLSGITFFKLTGLNIGWDWDCLSHNKYGPVTMIVPASDHQVRCIPWVQMGTFNKEIGFLCGLKFFALNIFLGEYLQLSLHLILQIWWKPLLLKMCR